MTQPAPQAAQEAHAPRPDPWTQPWKRNPFVLAFFVGALTITWLHFRLRHIPDPPPQLGMIPAMSWDESGMTGGESPIGSRLTVLAFVDPQGGSSCGSVRVLRKLSYRLEAAGLEAGYALLPAGDEVDDKALHRLVSEAAVVHGGAWSARLAEGQSFAPLRQWFEEGVERSDAWREGQRLPLGAAWLAAPACAESADRMLSSVVLLDASGELRGVYDAWGWDAESELTQRVRHVWAEQKSGRAP